ncbi:MAG: TIGR03016 family PEP-CTERM system-associated outer membrane protein [Pseudomonadota bacterium]|nr:TIGR03016 family PEP-CTERM system-associated outer membrane protein [Pseudomonadota bacterium]
MPSCCWPARYLPVVGVMAVAAAGAQAQTSAAEGAAAGRVFSIVPSFSVSETLTDNSRLTTNNRQAELITQVSPGLRIVSSGGRIKGFLDYSLSGLVYARHSAGNELQNSLNAFGTAEAIENWAYLDVSANVSQQSISAFGTQSRDASLANSNRTEVRTYSLSPYVRGRLADFANYEARVTQTSTTSSTSAASDATTSDASLRLSGSSSLSTVSWSANASHQVYDFSAGRQTENDLFRAALTWAVDPELRFSAIGGYEANNLVSADKQGHSISGLGVDWLPTERTRLSATAERRFFGISHALDFTHRTPRTVWRFSDSRNISTGLGQPTLGSQGTAFDLFYSLFASQQPDPALRGQLVNSFLQANGISPTATVFTASLASAVTLVRRQELSFALLGLRDTVLLAVSQGEARRLDSVVVVSDDFANSNLVRERGFTVSWAHRLTPQSALNLLASLGRTSGTVGSPSTTLRSVMLNWTNRVGARTNLILGARHAVFDSTSQPYTESAVTANLSFQF